MNRNILSLFTLQFSCKINSMTKYRNTFVIKWSQMITTTCFQFFQVQVAYEGMTTEKPLITILIPQLTPKI